LDPERSDVVRRAIVSRHSSLMEQWVGTGEGQKDVTLVIQIADQMDGKEKRH
jgi:hypothetical protein